MGAQAKFARLLGWSFSTLWRQLNGKSLITQIDELAIRQVARYSWGNGLRPPCWRKK